jgi:hypothetical protein
VLLQTCDEWDHFCNLLWNAMLVPAGLDPNQILCQFGLGSRLDTKQWKGMNHAHFNQSNQTYPLAKVHKTATVAVFKFNENGPVNRPTDQLAEKLGFVGTVRGRLPVGLVTEPAQLGQLPRFCEPCPWQVGLWLARASQALTIYSLCSEKPNVSDKVWVKHWESKSSITFKLLSLHMWKLYA